VKQEYTIHEGVVKNMQLLAGNTTQKEDGMGIWTQIFSVLFLQLSFFLCVYGTPPHEERIHFGSKKSGFVVADGSTMSFVDGIPLSSGTLRRVNGTFIAPSLVCSSMNIESIVASDAYAWVTDGTLNIGSDIILNSGHVLGLQGGSIPELIRVTGTATITGQGSFESDIFVSAGAHLFLGLNSPLDSYIMLEGAVDDDPTRITLLNDLVITAPFGIQTAYGNVADTFNYLDCNGHTVYLEGNEQNPGVISSFLFWESADLVLRAPLIMQSPMVFTATGGMLHGGGNVITLSEYGRFVIDEENTLTLSDSIIDGVRANTFTGGECILNAVTLRNSAGSLLVSGTFVDSWTYLLGGTGTIEDASITLQSDLTFGGTWTMLGTSSIQGNGHSLDIGAGNIVVPNGAELMLQNVILDNVSTAAIGGGGIIHLSEVTLILGETPVDWTGTRPQLVVDGPVVIVTGQHTLIAPTGSIINNTTVWYDTRGTGDANNVTGFSGSGRVSYVADGARGVSGGSIISDDEILDTSLYLYPEITGAVSNVLRFEQASSIDYNGCGHTLVCPATSAGLLQDGETEAVVFVGDGQTDTTVIMTHVTLDGFKPAHLQCTGGADQLVFGDQTIVQVKQDWITHDALDQQLFFGSSDTAENEEMCFDLQGHTVSLASSNARVVLRGAASSSLRIKNGRLVGVADTFAGEDPSIVCVGGAKIIFENVEVCLTSTLSLVAFPIDIVGHCAISGVYGAQMMFIGEDIVFTITSHAVLTLHDGIEYYHGVSGANSFGFEDATSTLELIGGCFRRQLFDEAMGDPLILKTGTVTVDHISQINVGDRGIQLGTGLLIEDLHLIIRPGATLQVMGADTLRYSNSE
jgi:hypothetical protein